MQMHILLLLAAAFFSIFTATTSRAEPLLTSGIGLASCGKLGPDIKPGAGLDHLPNALLFYWTQGYLSAANVSLLNKYSEYVDLGSVSEPTITQIVSDFCKANPDKKPISAIDGYIHTIKKVGAKQSDAFNPWDYKSTSAVAATAAESGDDARWIDQCVKDNKGDAKAEVILKYCTCMNNKMDDDEAQSITQWEKTHVAERRACDRESGWR